MSGKAGPPDSAGAVQASFASAVGWLDAASEAKPDRPAPFSLRLSAKELLEAQAGDQPIGAHIRARLLGTEADHRVKSRRPRTDHQMLALILAELGRSRLSSNMNQIAKAANMGSLASLGAFPELIADLQQACQDIRALREMLISALGLKVED